MNKYLDDPLKSTFLLVSFLAALKYEDHALKDSIIKFMVYKLIDREINKTYKTLIKYLKRTGRSEQELLYFIKHTS